MPKHFTHVTVRVIVWKERIEKGSRCSKKKPKRTKGFMLILMGEKRRESEDWIFFKDT